jgi:hypothetical protein
VCATPIGAGAGFAGGASSSGDQNYSGPAGYQQGQGYGGYGNQSYPGAGYSTPASRSSKMPLVIGAIVLVLLIGGGVAAYFLWFNKPSAATNSNTATNTTGPVAADSPKQVVEKVLRALEKADRSMVRSLVVKATSDKDVDDLVQEASKDIQSHGGIDTMTVDERPPNGDTAEARFNLKYKDGKSQGGGWNLAKEDGLWKIKLSR